MSLMDQLKRRPTHGKRVNADMLVEALILVGEQQLYEPRIDILDGSLQPPTSLGVGVGAQQSAVAVEHAMRRVEIFAERRRAERCDPDTGGNGGNRGSAGKTCEREPPTCHFAAVISMVPVAVRPKRSGRYMSSTLACGSTYLPGDTA